MWLCGGRKNARNSAIRCGSNGQSILFLQASTPASSPPTYKNDPALAFGNNVDGDSLLHQFGSPQLLQPMASVEPKEHRKLCCEEGCKSPARALGRCKRHGGSKRCSSPGCDKSVQTRGLCIRHVAHVAKIADVRELHRAMTNAGCTAILCRKHGGGIKCCIAGCDKWAQRKGMCTKHVKELLSSDDMAKNPSRNSSTTASAVTASYQVPRRAVEYFCTIKGVVVRDMH
ncbi:hypothetical protein GQ600_8603 [Phytophthora cactorum]|nr:hypothetical protein GQ600_8603 [Phytophthora cactorum]